MEKVCPISSKAASEELMPTGQLAARPRRAEHQARPGPSVLPEPCYSQWPWVADLPTLGKRQGRPRHCAIMFIRLDFDVCSRQITE